MLLCKVSNVFNDVRCPICGQGFLVYWTHARAGGAVARAEERLTLHRTLREQHTGNNGEEAHLPAFQIAESFTAAPEPLHVSMPVEALVGMYS